ncbi:MAG: hypothetical protein H3Z50_01295 [archaeon]|nr:hypothetical protein [archaeon]MCP8306253.1 hypothetical protein [archaeon]
MRSRLLPLMGIIGVAWLLVFLGSYIIFHLIVPIDLFPGRTDYIFTFFNSLLKVTLSTVLSVMWILIMIKLRDIYIKRKLSD